MNRRIVERIMWAATGAVILLGFRSVVNGTPKQSREQVAGRRASALVHGMPVLSMFESDSLDSAAARVAAHDPFRLERKPASIAYSPNVPGIIMPPAPPAPVIRIALQGTLGGPPWQAIISGVPGRTGTVVVSPGDTLGGITIRRVNRDSVTVRVKDSTWTVSMMRGGVQ